MSDSVQDTTVQLLMEIRSDLGALREDMGGLRREIASLRQGTARLDQTNQRLDKMIETMRSSWRRPPRRK